jgi:hypothetical protein
MFTEAVVQFVAGGLFGLVMLCSRVSRQGRGSLTAGAPVFTTNSGSP